MASSVPDFQTKLRCFHHQSHPVAVKLPGVVLPAVSERYRGSPPGSLRVFWLSEKIVIALLQHAASGLPLLRLVGFK